MRRPAKSWKSTRTTRGEIGAFANRRVKHQNELARLFRSADIDAIEVRTGEPYAGALGKFFETREKRSAVATDDEFLPSSFHRSHPRASNWTRRFHFQDALKLSLIDIPNLWAWIIGAVVGAMAYGRRIRLVAAFGGRGARNRRRCSTAAATRPGASSPGGAAADR